MIDDDEGIIELLTTYLTEIGYDVSAAANSQEMRKVMVNNQPDLIVLDLNLPGESGFDIARNIRATSRIPIIMLTGRNDEVDRVVGLEIGADDYVSKPFSIREFGARIGAVMRRVNEPFMAAQAGFTGAPITTNVDAIVYKFGLWRLDTGTGSLTDEQDKPVKLTTGEYRLLLSFIEHPNRVLSRQQLLDFTGGVNTEAMDRSIDIQVMRLRRKIEPNNNHPVVIETIRGLGYMFTAPVSKA